MQCDITQSAVTDAVAGKGDGNLHSCWMEDKASYQDEAVIRT